MLIECESLNYVAPLAQLIAGTVRSLPEVLDAFRNGGGVPYSSYGQGLREGQAAINFSVFAHQLAGEWPPSLEDVHTRLQSDPPAHMAEISCGYGFSSIGIALFLRNRRSAGYPSWQAVLPGHHNACIISAPWAIHCNRIENAVANKMIVRSN